MAAKIRGLFFFSLVGGCFVGGLFALVAFAAPDVNIAEAFWRFFPLGALVGFGFGGIATGLFEKPGLKAMAFLDRLEKALR